MESRNDRGLIPRAGTESLFIGFFRHHCEVKISNLLTSSYTPLSLSLSLLLDEAMYLNVTLLLSSSNSSSSCTGHLKFSLLSGQGDCIFSQSGCSHPSSEGVSSEITSGECYHGVELSKIGKLRLMSSLGVTPKSSPMLLTPSSATPED